MLLTFSTCDEWRSQLRALQRDIGWVFIKDVLKALLGCLVFLMVEVLAQWADLFMQLV